MGQWILTAGLQNLRNQVNTAFPNRSTLSDGTIGDAAHRAEISGHNPDDTPGSKPEWDGDPDNIPEVRAWDMTAALGNPNVSTQDLIDHLRSLPDLGTVIRYMIYDRKMYHVDNDFEPVPYTGASAHTEHVHFSGARTQEADNNTSYDYQIWEITMDDATLNQIANKIWTSDVDTSGGSYSARGALLDATRRAAAVTNTQIPELDAKLDDLTVKMDTIIAWINAHA